MWCPASHAKLQVDRDCPLLPQLTARFECVACDQGRGPAIAAVLFCIIQFKLQLNSGPVPKLPFPKNARCAALRVQSQVDQCPRSQISSSFPQSLNTGGCLQQAVPASGSKICQSGAAWSNARTCHIQWATSSLSPRRWCPTIMIRASSAHTAMCQAGFACKTYRTASSGSLTALHVSLRTLPAAYGFTLIGSVAAMCCQMSAMRHSEMRAHLMHRVCWADFCDAAFVQGVYP